QLNIEWRIVLDHFDDLPGKGPGVLHVDELIDRLPLGDHAEIDLSRIENHVAPAEGRDSQGGRGSVVRPNSDVNANGFGPGKLPGVHEHVDIGSLLGLHQPGAGSYRDTPAATANVRDLEIDRINIGERKSIGELAAARHGAEVVAQV